MIQVNPYFQKLQIVQLLPVRSFSLLTTMAGATRKFIDIGVNLTDPMYQGSYHGSNKHQPDLDIVLQRAWDAGIDKMMITGTSLPDSKDALKLAKTNEKLYCTVGCHPTRCGEFEAEGTDPEQYLSDLLQLVQDNQDKVVAIGECGLDYDRTKFCSIDLQKKYFEKQISLAEITGLPMFLHCRNAASDLIDILTPHRENISGGVVHSFDGTKEEAETILDLDLYIGINGCSLKKEENLLVAGNIPSSRLMIETDCPWCEIRPTHAGNKHIQTTFPSKKKEKWEKASMVKGRNEPNFIVQVLEVLSAVKGEDADQLCETLYNNTQHVFFKKDSL